MSDRAVRVRWSPLVGTAGVLAAVALAACSRGGEAREIRPARIESTAAADAIAAEGARILRVIAEARGDIHRRYPHRAEGHIDRADRMLDSVEQSMPTAEVRRRIWVARKHLEYAEAQDVTGDLVPIYAAVEEVKSLVPADSIRGHLDRAEQHLEREDREAARRELIRADQELLFVEADLPLRSTRHHLAEAREALEMGQPDRAGASLRQAEDALMLLTGIVESPLGAARWSLAKAVAEYKRGDSEEAERYVTIARQSLERISENQSEAARTTLKAVVAELRSLEGRIAIHSANPLEKLEQQVDRVRDLALRS